MFFDAFGRFALGQISLPTEPAPTGGGTSGGSSASGTRGKRKTGLEPVKRLPPRKVETVERAIPLPPPSFIRSPPIATNQLAPLELGDRDLIPADLLGLQASIHAAEDATDLQDILDPDLQDILDIVAFLDSSSI